MTGKNGDYGVDSDGISVLTFFVRRMLALAIQGASNTMTEQAAIKKRDGQHSYDENMA